MNEMRCGLHTKVGRVWTTRGNRVVVPVQQKCEWNYVYGAKWYYGNLWIAGVFQKPLPADEKSQFEPRNVFNRLDYSL
jgi:hypothetical protein